MNPLVFWNELAEHPLAASVVDGNTRMNQLVDTLAALRRAVPGAPAPRLRSYEQLPATMLAEGHTIADWQTRADELRRRFFLQLAASSPLLQRGDDASSMHRYGCSDCWVEGTSATGFRAAWAVDELAVSLESSDRWGHSTMAAEIDELGDDGKSTRRPVSIRHLARVAHVGAHTPWLVERVRLSVVDGRDLWQRRMKLFPNLEFCKEVERQLDAIDAGSDQFRQVFVRLCALDIAIAECTRSNTWAPVNSDFLPFKCTTETQHTLEEEAAAHTATRPDGTRQLFKWHVRFTPGAGRIFFDVDPTVARGVVGYVGVKKGGKLS